MTPLLNTATGPQIQAELLGRAVARGILQIGAAETTLATLREKQAHREQEVLDQAIAECAALGNALMAAHGDGELAYWRLVKRAYPDSCTPYIDLRIRLLESQQRKERAA